MPEGPELHLAAQFVRSIGHRHLFSGAVVKSEVSLKNPDVPWNRPEYRVDAVSRGKGKRTFLVTERVNRVVNFSPNAECYVAISQVSSFRLWQFSFLHPFNTICSNLK